MKAALASAALLVFLAIGCQGGDEAPSALTSTPITASSPTSASPSAAPQEERTARLVFLRPQIDAHWEPGGVIHMSEVSGGSNAVQLTPADVRATFVGLAERDGATVLYYFAPDKTGDFFNLQARDLASGETVTLASTERAEDETYQVGRLSPDGRYVAWAHREGIDLLDLTTNGRRRILISNRAGCDSGPISQCYAYSVPAWSPDGRLLLATKTFYEGGAAVVVDPFQETPQEMGLPQSGGLAAGFAVWSPTSDAWCGYGRYGGPSGLYLSRQPEWQPSNLLPEYETPEPSAPWRSVSDCVWLDEHRIAFAITAAGPGDGSQSSTSVSIYDLTTAAVTSLADIGVSSSAGFPPDLFVVSGTATLLFNDREGGQPGAINTTDGARTPILEPGDVVVAVTQPIAVPEGVVAATPQVQPCVPLTAHCEVKVTNVAPDQLNVREGAGQDDRVVGGLSEGEIVCLTGSDEFGEDDFRWWPMRSQAGLEGWVAQADPQEPERPWLTATGRKCEE